LENLEILDGFFEVVKNQNWVKPVEILRIQEEYDRIRAEFKKIFKRPSEIPVEEKITEVRPRQIRQQLSEREEKILSFLKENGRAQVWQLKQIFPEVTKRTLRRDFRYLLKQGKIERFGQRNQTFYQLKT
jgi:predicted HTH transcriptional regulator